MAALGDIGQDAGEGDVWSRGYTAAVPFTSLWRSDDAERFRPKTHRTQNTACIATIIGATAGALVTLLREGTFVGSAFADGSGNAVFYEIDSTSPTSLFYAVEVGSANAWEVEVSGATATVTALSGGGGGGTSSFGYVG